MSATEPYNHTPSQHSANSGVPIGSVAGEIITFNSDSRLLNSPSRDPWAVLSGKTAHHENVRIVKRPSGMAYLALMHAWSPQGLAPTDSEQSSDQSEDLRTTLITVPKVRIFGSLERGLVPQPYRKYPHDVDVAEDDFASVDSIGGWWRPILNTDDPTVPLAENFLEPSEVDDPSPVMQYTEDGEEFYVGLPIIFHLNGVEQVMVNISQAAVFSPAATRSLVIGHFFG